MTKIMTEISGAFQRSLKDLYGIDQDPVIRPATNESFGDFQSNVAFDLARKLPPKDGKPRNPRAVAEEISRHVNLGETAKEVSVAGGGFINIKLSPKWVGGLLKDLVTDERLRVPKVEHPQRTIIDYCGVNVAKQMHVGHLRSTNIGDALARILEFLGHEIIRQNHIGDWGTQFGMLLQYLSEAKQEKTDTLADLERVYRAAKIRFDNEPGFAERARKMVVALQAGDPEARGLWIKLIDVSRTGFEEIYHRLNVKLTRADERGESFYNDMLEPVVKALCDKGIGEESEGAIVVRVAGFEAPLIIRKRDGGFGYGTTDLAALRYRSEQLRGDRIIYVVDVRQSQHLAQCFDTARRAGWLEKASAHHVKFGTILGDDGTPFKTRSGDTVKLAELLDEAEGRALRLVGEKLAERQEQMSGEDQKKIAKAVGVGAIKYFDLNRDSVNNYTFSWENMLSLDGNTAPYLQYAYARVSSILRKGGVEPGSVRPSEILLDSPVELALAKDLLALDGVLLEVADDLKAHHLCKYLFDLSVRFSSFYQACPVLAAPEPQRTSRLALTDLVGRTLALGMDLLGIEHPGRL